MNEINNQTEKLKQLKLLLLDVDGVLTNGGIIYDDANVETKIFNAKDGFGIRLLMESGVDVGIVTGRISDVLYHRCKNLNITTIFDGVKNKAVVLDKIIRETGLKTEEIAFAGDDLPDIPLLKQVGVSFAVADACSDVRKIANIVTSIEGGKGAVREICETILQAKGIWENILKDYISQ